MESVDAIGGASDSLSEMSMVRRAIFKGVPQYAGGGGVCTVFMFGDDMRARGGYLTTAGGAPLSIHHSSSTSVAVQGLTKLGFGDPVISSNDSIELRTHMIHAPTDGRCQPLPIMLIVSTGFTTLSLSNVPKSSGKSSDAAKPASVG